MEGITTKPGIYYFKNKCNGKYYIGQACNLQRRYKNHLYAFKSNKIDNLLYRAFHKYSIENFEYKVLQTIEEQLDASELKNKLDKLEKHYIKKYNSYNNGYNQTLGGDYGVLGYKFTEQQIEHQRESARKRSTDGRYQVYVYSKDSEQIHTFSNLLEAAKYFNIKPNSLRTAKCSHRWYLSKYYASNSKEEIESELSKGIPQNSSDYLIDYYNYLQQFTNISIEKICKDLQLDRSTIAFRNKKLKELGYTNLPFKSKPKIISIDLIDTINNTVTNYTLENLSQFFNISIDSMRNQLRRKSLYKKRYIFKVNK